MRYFVPQIQHQMKIGGLTFKQSFFIIGGVAICLIVLFTSPESTIYIAIPVMTISLFLAFGKIKGIELPIFLKNWWDHLFGPKEYRWMKRAIIAKPLEMKYNPPVKESNKKEASLIKKRSSLVDLSQKNI